MDKIIKQQLAALCILWAGGCAKHTPFSFAGSKLDITAADRSVGMSGQVSPTTHLATRTTITIPFILPGRTIYP
jgi:hypothetical protein